MPEPLVSVCLPVYNGERYLRQSIESVLAQSYTNFELLIADDGSTDGSAELCVRYANRDRRVQFWRNDKRRGLFGNYNGCMQRASGEFIKPFAQDDILHPEMLARAVDIFRAHESVCLVSVGRSWVDETGADISRHVKSPRSDEYVPADRPVPGSVVVRKALSPVKNFIGEPVAVMFRADIKGDGFDEDFAHIGDFEYWLRLVYHGSYYFKNEVLCKYRSHPDCQTRKNWADCLIATDFLKLGDKCGWVLDEVGISRDAFIAENIRSAAVGAACLWDGKRLDVIPIEDPFSENIIATPRERALLQVVASLNRLPAPSSARLEQDVHLRGKSATNADSMRALERKLADMLSSPSWLCTRPLREINRLLGSNSKTLGVLERRLSHPDLRDMDQQRAYLTYLRRAIGAVRCSRSWRLSAPIRMFKG